FLIFVTDRHLFWQNRFIYLVASVLVNIIRSVPFVILLVLLLPLVVPVSAGSAPRDTSLFAATAVPDAGSAPIFCTNSGFSGI
ncbi:hypothetical protein MJL81_34025, partial [Salmonella enterica subsp. enterica serovar Anatum]|nr:hypothetical protein [Salmonella enterica subsp. enterica serovar Anatum]